MGFKLIIISGASGGLGKELVTYLSKKFSLVCLYLNTPISSLKNVDPCRLDICNEEDIKNFIALKKAELKDITLINMATYSFDGLVINYDSDEWKKTFDVNVNGPFYLIKNLLPLMVDQKYGRIISISSFLASEGAAGAAAYSSSKSSLIGLTKSLSKEYGRFNITSNIIELGYFNRGLIERFSKEDLEKALKIIPLKKLGNVKEISETIKLIINSEYINGSILKLNGGIS